MAIRVAINGFGRIGRCILRAAWSNPARTDEFLMEQIFDSFPANDFPLKTQAFGE